MKIKYFKTNKIKNLTPNQSVSLKNHFLFEITDNFIPLYLFFSVFGQQIENSWGLFLYLDLCTNVSQ